MRIQALPKTTCPRGSKSLTLALTIGLFVLGPPASAADGSEVARRGQAVEILLMDETTRVTVVLGETTLKEALRLFPRAPGRKYEGNPRPTSPDRAPQFPTLEKPVTVFNPWMSMNALYFDDHNRLIMLATLGATPDGKTRLEEGDISSLGLVEVSREGDIAYFHRRFNECSTFDVGVDMTRGGAVDGSTWSFTCETEPAER